MVSFKSVEDLVVYVSGVISEREMLFRRYLNLKAEIAKVQQEVEEISTLFRADLEATQKYVVKLKDYVHENGLGDTHVLNDIIAEFEELVTSYSKWFDDNEMKE